MGNSLLAVRGINHKYIVVVDGNAIMKIEEIEKKICNLICEKSGMDQEIRMSDPLGEYLNSITYIQFLIACEDTFGIEVEDEELDMINFSDVKSIVAFINNKLVDKVVD